MHAQRETIITFPPYAIAYKIMITYQNAQLLSRRSIYNRAAVLKTIVHVKKL